MPCRDDTAIADYQRRIDRVHDFRIRNRIDLVEPDDLGISSQAHEVAAANDVQMSDAHVVFDDQFLHARDDVEMPDRHIVVNLALARIDYAHPDANSFADPVAEEPAIERAL